MGASKASADLGHAVRDGIAQHSIDTRLPASASGLESLKHFSINTHIQGGVFTLTRGLPRPRVIVAAFQ
jgi:hypothetical protein